MIDSVYITQLKTAAKENFVWTLVGALVDVSSTLTGDFKV